MKIKKFSLIIFITVFSFASFAGNNTSCECGSHSTGITSFTVSGVNSDCCSGVAFGIGIDYTYIQQNNGVWMLDSSETRTAVSAQNACCNQS